MQKNLAEFDHAWLDASSRILQGTVVCRRISFILVSPNTPNLLTFRVNSGLTTANHDGVQKFDSLTAALCSLDRAYSCTTSLISLLFAIHICFSHVEHGQHIEVSLCLGHYNTTTTDVRKHTNTLHGLDDMFEMWWFLGTDNTDNFRIRISLYRTTYTYNKRCPSAGMTILMNCLWGCIRLKQKALLLTLPNVPELQNYFWQKLKSYLTKRGFSLSQIWP